VSDGIRAGRKEIDEAYEAGRKEADEVERTLPIDAGQDDTVSDGIPNPISIGPPVSVGGSAKSSGLTANVKEIEINPRRNELNNYSSYTYNIALYMLTPKEYIKMMENPLDAGSANKFLIARSGGIGAGEKPKAEHFDVDFFIDDVQLTNTAASPNTDATNTNAVKIQFELNEPNGVTLLERLKEQAKLSLAEDEKSYTEAPYLMEITFKGYDDHGRLYSGDIKPKYIPIKFINIKFTVNNSGAIYRIVAIPYHHNVFRSIYSNIPINIQVKAGTVKDIFGQSATAQLITSEQVRGEKTVFADEDEDPVTIEILKTVDKASTEKVSLTAAINSFFKKLTKPSIQKDKTKKESKVEGMQSKADVWEFAMADEIGNAKIMPSRFDALNTSGKTKKVYEQHIATLRGKVGLDKTKQLFRINDGTDLIQLMNAIIIGSDYIDDNLLNDIEAARVAKEPQGKQINWFKIVPQIIDVIGWDSKANRYKWRIRWTVETTGVFYNDYAWSPKTKPKGKGIHKIYDYIFSGENSEVLSFRLNFDVAFLQAVTLGTGIPNAANDTVQNDFVSQKKITSRNSRASGMIADDTVKKKRSKDLMTTIMHTGSDLIRADIDIIGDPAFLPIGDALFQPIGNDNTIWDTPFLPDGTINYNLTPPYIQVNLKTPTDYDELTGFADPNQKHKYSSSQFSGVYQVLRIKSTFSGGVFTQNLIAPRAAMQPINGKIGRSKEGLDNTERKEFFQDVRQYVSALQYLSDELPEIANNLGAKITDFARSASTNIGTNILGRIASEVNQNRDAVFFDADDVGTLVDVPEETLTQRAARSSDHTDILIT